MGETTIYCIIKLTILTNELENKTKSNQRCKLLIELNYSFYWITDTLTNQIQTCNQYCSQEFLYGEKSLHSFEKIISTEITIS